MNEEKEREVNELIKQTRRQNEVMRETTQKQKK
jgi:hypothetical protein